MLENALEECAFFRYRAVVEKVSGSNQIHILYIDFGNVCLQRCLIKFRIIFILAAGGDEPFKVGSALLYLYKV